MFNYLINEKLDNNRKISPSHKNYIILNMLIDDKTSYDNNIDKFCLDYDRKKYCDIDYVNLLIDKKLFAHAVYLYCISTDGNYYNSSVNIENDNIYDITRDIECLKYAILLNKISEYVIIDFYISKKSIFMLKNIGDKYSRMLITNSYINHYDYCYGCEFCTNKKSEDICFSILNFIIKKCYDMYKSDWKFALDYNYKKFIDVDYNHTGCYSTINLNKCKLIFKDRSNLEWY